MAVCKNQNATEHAPLAQLAERRTLNPQVPGSSPGGRTTVNPDFSTIREVRVSACNDMKAAKCYRIANERSESDYFDAEMSTAKASSSAAAAWPVIWSPTCW